MYRYRCVVCFAYTPRSGIAGSYAGSGLRFLNKGNILLIVLGAGKSNVKILADWYLMKTNFLVRRCHHFMGGR